ncbi:epoxide hydrolase family protein [Brucella haematophila]|uniref:epoxide hydrolase family protein n=1 Tax=Brucella haematophila TaxID=419474 RepID=UPI00110DA6E5|nr:epoxide hydrolase family protein [Brucella haematophila]TMV04565.1 epoxide hydrolase [Brucella haematophila]
MHPFKIKIPDEQIDDLKHRLRYARLPGAIFQEGSEDGIPLPFIRKLKDHWLENFDWREQEARLNRLPQFQTLIQDCTIHFVHAKGVGPSPAPIVLTHGWPGSFVEFEKLISHLTDPASHGADPSDAFDVVVPSLPGFGFSAAPVAPGTSSRRVAALWQELMLSLGYQKYFAQGGDIGAGVSTWLAALYPQSVTGVHLNYISASFRPPTGPDFPPVSAEENAFFERVSKFAAEEGAYSALQATKPQTLSYALADSPIGLAAWISEKFESWSDHTGDLETVVSIDELLTNICIYWFGNSIDASLRIYKENRNQPLILDEFLPCEVPFAIAHFPKELPIPPQSWIERALRVERWTEMPRGGHFAALEQPQALAEDIRAAFRPWRSRIV